MLIRSQKKKSIINFDNINCLRIRPEYGKTSISIVADCGNENIITIGNYINIERCIEILDMIQNKYLENKKINNYLSEDIFQMPLE